nr:cell division inhibitor [Bacillus sp. m3-13]
MQVPLAITALLKRKLLQKKTLLLDLTFLLRPFMPGKKKAEHAKAEGVRTVFTRFGIILDKGEGALPRMMLPYKMFVGGKNRFW